MAQQQLKLNKLFLICLTLATFLCGVYVVWRLDTDPRTDDAYVYADTIQVTPEVSGRIIDLPVRDNQAVKQGDILLRIDPRPFEETLAKARAGLIALDKEIDLAQREVNAQQFTADAAEASLKHANAALRQALSTYKRLEPLQKPGFASAEQVDQARTALRLAESQQSQALYASKSAAAAVSSVEALVAQKEVLEAEIALAELQLEWATVKAPFDGRVIGLRTTTGQYAAAGHAIFTLADTQTWYVVANFRETDLEGMAPGDHARVYLMSDTSRKFAAVVDSLGFGVQPDDENFTASGLPAVKRAINWVRIAQRFPVKFQVEAPDPALFRVGASAVVLVTGRAHP